MPSVRGESMGRKYCVVAGKKKLKCFRKKGKAKKMAKARRKRGLKARVVRRSTKKKR